MEIYKLDLEGRKITDIKIHEEENVTFYFDTDTESIKIETYHSQDCCEHVYADFSPVKYEIPNIIGRNAYTLVIKVVEDMGFLLCIAGNKVFIPCYNSQNGYYGDGLSIIITKGNVKTEVDITNCVEDNIH